MQNIFFRVCQFDAAPVNCGVKIRQNSFVEMKFLWSYFFAANLQCPQSSLSRFCTFLTGVA